MGEPRNRDLVYQDYYTEEDYSDVIMRLPDIIKDAEMKAAFVIEPTIYEKRDVMEEIKKFIRNKHRKVYGGTALNEAIKQINPEDAFYNEYSFSDIEFYSTTPKPDLVELCNLLHEKGYKYIRGSEAQHEETFTIFVNFQVYCDITYVPARVYNGIKTISIDGISYVHPHFMLIDYLRMINQPLTAASQRWEKAFKRMYLLLKNYPFEYFKGMLNIKKPLTEIQSYIDKIKNSFLLVKENQESCLLTGLDAYNFYIYNAMNDKTYSQMSRTSFNKKKISNMLTNVPYVEILTVSYRDTVERLYDFIKKIVPDPTKITIDEYFPLFQFTNNTVAIGYEGTIIVKIYEGDGFCVPTVKDNKQRMYGSYQYTLMSLLISKFNAHLDKNKEMYFNYSLAISNLVDARNTFLNNKKIGVINDTVFGEFRINCIGSTASYSMTGRLRAIKNAKAGKKPFRYAPDEFLNASSDTQEKFNNNLQKPTSGFKNTSGNKNTTGKNLLFKIDFENNLVQNYQADSDDAEQDRIKNIVNGDSGVGGVGNGVDGVGNGVNDVGLDIDPDNKSDNLDTVFKSDTESANTETSNTETSVF